MAENLYNRIKILETSSKKKYYTNIFYPEVVLSDNDIYVITNQGDRLDLLADQFYGDKDLWKIISIANDLKQNSLFIPEGTQLRIPTNLQEILSSYYSLNG